MKHLYKYIVGFTSLMLVTNTAFSQFTIDRVITTPVKCNGDANGKMHIYITPGGVAPYVYYFVKLSDPADSKTATSSNLDYEFKDLGAGSYDIVGVKDKNGTGTSVRVYDVIIDEPAPISISVLPATPITACNDIQKQLNTDINGGNGGFTYKWTGTGAAFLDQDNIINPTFRCNVENTYSLTVTATDINNCIASANATITVNALPTQHTVTGGGEYCQGGTGVAVGLNGSQSGVRYQLYVDGNPIGSPVNGNGGAITFGNQTTAGTYTVDATNVTTGCPNAMLGSQTVIINPLPAAITGASNVCVGSTITLSDATAGGTWSSATPAVATINASGVVTGVSAGTSVISYTLPTGCAVTKTITVNPLPAAITGTTNVCVASTTTLSDATGGGTWSSATPAVATISAAGVVTGVSAGTSVISYTLPTGCAVTTTVTVNPLPAAITGASNVCVGSTITLSDATAGGTWSSATPAVATINASGVVTGVSAGTSVISYTLGTGCAVTKTITVNPLPAAITGTTNVCVGSTTTLSDATVGGTWSSATPAVATISAAGVVTGVSAGTSVISYTLPTGCAVTTTVTVNPLPVAITGASNVCVGSTITLSDATVGGTWSSATPAVATINASGVVTGVSAGTSVISYTLGTGCAVTKTITVNPLPAAITGTTNVCIGSTTTLSDATVGGTWSSATPAVATINGSGVVTGVSAGTSVISYTLPTGCAVTTTVTVNPLPVAITGASNVCVGSTITLSDATVGGTWSSATPAVATINASGVVTGVSAGTSVISYTLGTGCAVTKTITVNPLPAAITGTTNVCVGSTTTLSDATGGGTWSSATPAVATISAAGVVTGVSAGTSVISYTLPTGCAVTTTVTVNPLPAAITGGSNVCVGSTITLSDATAGGTWSSATPAVATINASGVVTGVSAGTSVISYTLGTGCAVTKTITVNPLPAAITGTTNVCVGSTTTLSDATGGGTWSSATPAVATISAAGVVSGVSAGTSVISYTLPTGCAVTTTVTVNPLPAAITGTTNVCVGSTTTLSDATAGGTWSSATPAVATISAAGVVTGVSAGTSVISYTLPTGCAVTTTVNVVPLPAAITGASNVCVGSTITLSDATAGGTWSSATPAVATINASGVVTGVSAGTSVISYTLGTGCAVTKTITVNPLPAAITGTVNVCVGSTTTLSDATAGGTWSSATLAVATINGSGVVTGVSAGTSVISYTLPTGCAVTATVTVNPLPAAITGTVNVCVGSTTTLSDATAGGTWSSATPAVATISAAGVVSGVSAGTSVISYTLPTGCAVTTTITVNPLPAAITGTTNVCVGSTTTLSDATVGGTWSSATPAVATINASGIVTGVSAGTSVISYTLPTGCAVTTTVTVNPLPAAITGASNVCVGSTITLSDATAGGTWSSATPAVATISAAGVVTGVSAGTSVISYTLPTGCAVTTTITVKNLPINTYTVSDKTICFLDDAIINVSGSEVGVTYQVLNPANNPVGSSVTGTGNAINLTIPNASIPLGVTNFKIQATSSNGCIIELSDRAIITKRAPVTETVISNNLQCNGDNSGIILVDASGGTTPYSISINGKNGNFSYLENVPVSVTAGNYIVVAKDVNNCKSAEFPVTITEPDPLTFTIDTASSTCSSTVDGHITITASGGTTPYLYSIYGDNPADYSTNNDYQNLPPDYYYIIVKDANDCKTDIDTISLVEPDPIVVGDSLPAVQTCYGDSSLYTLLASGGSGQYEYSMSQTLGVPGPWVSTNVFTLMTNINYFGFVRDKRSHCIAFANNGLAINIPSKPKIKINVAKIDSVSPCYYSANGLIKLNASTGGFGLPFEYYLDGVNKGTNRNYTGLLAGQHTIKVVDKKGCHQDTVLKIGAPPVIYYDSVKTKNLTCYNVKIGEIHAYAHGGRGTLSYAYNTEPYKPTGDFTGLDGGWYKVHVKDGFSCLRDTDIKLDEPFEFVISSAVPTNITCNARTDGKVTVVANGGTKPYKFTLYPVGTVSNSTGIFNNLSKGKYVVRIIDKNLCDTLWTDSLEVKEPAVIAIDSIRSSNILCGGQSTGKITVYAKGGTAPLTYSLTPGTFSNQNGIFNNIPANTYNISVTDVNSCTPATGGPVTITQPTPLSFTSITLTNLKCYQSGDGMITAVATGGTGSLHYQLDGSAIQPNGNFSALSSGNHSIHVTDDNSCPLDSTVKLQEPAQIAITTAKATNVSCPGSTDGKIEVSATGGTSPYTFKLQPSVLPDNATGKFEPLAAGDYTVIVTDSKACKADTSDKLTILNGTPLVINVDSVNPTCNTLGSITIHVTGGKGPFRYSIHGNSGYGASPSFTSLNTGIYDIWVATACDSVNFGKVTLEGTAPITSTLDVTNIQGCNGDSTGIIVVHARGGSGNPKFFSIDGKAPQTDSTFRNLKAGAHSITIIDGECNVNINQNLTQPQKVDITNVSIIKSQVKFIDDATIVQHLPDRNYALDSRALSEYWTWTGTPGENNFLVDFDLSKIPAGATIDSASIALYNYNQPQEYISPDTTNASLIRRITSDWDESTVTWNTKPTTTALNQVRIPKSVSPTQNYYLSVTQLVKDMISNPASSFGFSIEPVQKKPYTRMSFASSNHTDVNLRPRLVVNYTLGGVSTKVTLMQKDSLCQSISITAGGGTGNLTYDLNNKLSQVNNGLFSCLDPGMYHITVTDDKGCSDIDSIEIVTPGELAVTVNTDSVKCYGDSNGAFYLHISGGEKPYSIKVNGTASDSIQKNIIAGTYTAQVTDNKGKSKTISFTVGGPLAINADFNNDNETGSNSDGVIRVVSVTGGSGIYTYSKNGLDFFSNNTFTGLKAGDYTITVKDSKLCSNNFPTTIYSDTILTLRFKDKHDVSCLGSADGSVTAKVLAGAAPYILELKRGGFSRKDTTYQREHIFMNIPAGNNYRIIGIAANGTSDTTVNFNIDKPKSKFVIDTVITAANTSLLSPNGRLDIRTSGGWAGTRMYSKDTLGVFGYDSTFTKLQGDSLYYVQAKDAGGCVVTDTGRVDNKYKLKISTSVTAERCKGSNNGTITVTIESGNGPFKFSKDNLTTSIAGTSPYTFTPLAPGDYNIAVTDKFDTVRTVVNVAAANPIVMSVDAYSSGKTPSGRIVVNATGGAGKLLYKYTSKVSGSDSSFNSTFTKLPVDTFFVTVKDTNKCSAGPDTAVVTLDTILRVKVTVKDLYCHDGGNGRIITVPQNGLEPVDYKLSWANGLIVQRDTLFDDLDSGTYYIYIIDADGKKFYDTVSVKDTVPPIIISAPKYEYPGCKSVKGSITLSVSGGTGKLKYEWWDKDDNKIGTEASIKDIKVGTYDFYVFDSLGCNIGNSYTLVERFLTMDSSKITNSDCNTGILNGSIDLYLKGTSPFKFNWTLNGKDSVNTDSLGHFIASQLAPGRYIINTDDGNQCTRIDTFQINAIDTISYNIIDTTDETCISLGKIKLQLSSSKPPIYVNWVNEKLDQFNSKSVVDSIEVIHGKYKVFISDDYGCYLDTLRLNIDTLNWLYINAGNDTSVCRNVAYVMNPQVNLGKEPYDGDVFYQWEPVANFENAYIRNAVVKQTLADAYKVNEHTYKLYATVNSRCKDSSEITLGYYPTNGVFLPPLNTVSRGRHEIVPIIGGSGSYVKYNWVPNVGIIEGSDTSRNLIIQITESQTYTFTGITEDGCPESDTVRVEVAPNVKPDKAITPDGNGIHDKWQISNAEFYNSDEITVEIFNRWGVKIFYSNGYDNISKVWDGTYKGKVLPMGVYYYVITVKGYSKPVKGTVTILNAK